MLLLIGLALTVIGALRLIPADVAQGTYVEGSYISQNTIALWTGVILSALSIVLLLAMRERFAVRIGTAEGEKDAVVSSRREYIAQIVDALTRARDHFRSSADAGTSYRIKPAG